jgi:uncharacterized membrane protein
MKLPPVRPLHEFYRRNLFYPLALSTLLCIVLFSGRMILSGTRDFYFLIWNLFLAWLPYLLSLWIVALRSKPLKRWWTLPLATVLWALFIPNAPYIMTDFGHLLRPRQFPFMYDVVMIFVFAWTGLLLGLASLHLLQAQVKQSWGGLAAGGFLLATTFMTGMGIYLGRFLRWNSWDLLRRPSTMFSTVAGIFQNPLGHKFAWAHTLMFATVVLMCYLTFMAFRDAVQRESTSPALP